MAKKKKQEEKHKHTDNMPIIFTDEAPLDEKELDEKLEKIIDIRLRGTYLPNLLVKLGEFPSNTEARQQIRTFGVKINGMIVKDIDYEIRQGDIFRVDINESVYNLEVISK